MDTTFLSRRQWATFVRYLCKYLIVECEGERKVLFGLSDSFHLTMLKNFEDELQKEARVLRAGMISVKGSFSFSLFGFSKSFSQQEITEAEAVILIKELLMLITGIEYDYLSE